MKKILLVSFMVLSLAACQNNNKKEVKKDVAPAQVPVNKPAFNHKSYKMKGMLIAKMTFRHFKSKIQEIGQKEGLPAVVNFCHDNAIKLTDSIGAAHHVVIKRTSFKLRNPDNKPDIDEEAVLNEYAKNLEAHKPMEPVVLKDSEGFVHFYAPIKVKQACLQCHGVPGKDIHEDVYKVIKQKYPDDKATGFKAGDLRGIWDIKFLDKNQEIK